MRIASSSEDESESESDCNYIGGVAYSAASSDNDSDTGSESEWSDDDSSDMKSMDELTMQARIMLRGTRVRTFFTSSPVALVSSQCAFPRTDQILLICKTLSKPV